MSHEALSATCPPLVFTGGKGGVGKTTCAAALSLLLARTVQPTEKVLVISTDPAHSLADSFNGAQADRLPQVWELNAEAELEQFKQENRQELLLLFDTSTYLEEEDIDALLSLSIPGLDELMSLKKIYDLVQSGQYRYIVVDTAPTGHCLRLLAMPELLNGWVKVMAQMRWKYRYLQERFRGHYNPDQADDLLLQLKRTVVRVRAMLSTPGKTGFWLVTRPEGMVVAETLRMAQHLRELGAPLLRVVANGVMQNPDGPFCRAMQQAQQPWLQQLHQTFTQVPVLELPLFPQAIRGLEGLGLLADLLANAQVVSPQGGR